MGGVNGSRVMRERLPLYRPWKGMTISCDEDDKTIFRAFTVIKIGDGRKTIFWQDRWIDRMTSMDLALNLYKKAHFNKRTVLMELSNKSWMHAAQHISSKEVH
jgi:hypothetical protein